MPRVWKPGLGENGHDYKGSQKYHCKTCNRYGTLHAQRGYDQQTRSQMQRALLERVSLRGIKRIFGVSRRTVADWLAMWDNTCRRWPIL